MTNKPITERIDCPVCEEYKALADEIKKLREENGKLKAVVEAAKKHVEPLRHAQVEYFGRLAPIHQKWLKETLEELEQALKELEGEHE